ncbi:MAG: acyl-CoA dehydratase activase-related protein [bacterium]
MVSRRHPRTFVFPVKVLHGHIAYLADKDKVDAIFLPRMVNVGTKATFCPKFLGLP